MARNQHRTRSTIIITSMGRAMPHHLCVGVNTVRSEHLYHSRWREFWPARRGFGWYPPASPLTWTLANCINNVFDPLYSLKK